MSIVPHATTARTGTRSEPSVISHSVSSGSSDSSLTISELPTLLKKWMAYEGEIASLNAQIRERRAQSKALRSAILGVMEKHSVATVNVTKGSVIHKIREKKETLSQDFIFKAAKQFFEEDEEKAKKLVEFLESQRGTTIVHDLKISKTRDSDSAST
jgi:hypothetical protein